MKQRFGFSMREGVAWVLVVGAFGLVGVFFWGREAPVRKLGGTVIQVANGGQLRIERVSLPPEALRRKREEAAALHVAARKEPFGALQAALGSHDEGLALHAALDEVVALGDGAVSSLRQLLSVTRDRSTLKTGAYALARIGTAPALDAFFEIVRQRTDPGERDLLLGVLASGASAPTVDLLIKRTGEEDDATLQKLLVQCLQSMREPRVVEALASAATKAGGGRRSRLLAALSNLKASELEPVLQKQLLSPDAGIAKAAAGALASHESLDGLRLILESFGLDSSFRDRARWELLVAAACRSVESHPRGEGVALAESLLATSSNEWSRSAAAAVLYATRKTGAEKDLRQLFQKTRNTERSPQVREVLDQMLKGL